MEQIEEQEREVGCMYLLVALFGAFGLVFVPFGPIVLGDGATVFIIILDSESLFRLGIASALITQTV